MSAAARLFDERHAGHAGTLDPLATGVLPVLLGRACKLLPYLPQEKRYTAGVQFGFRTDTADVTGCRVLKNPKMPTRDELLEILPRFTGKVDQIPPMYAAVKLDGRPLYEYARAGREVERRPRTVEIYALTLLEYDSVSMTAVLDVHCSGGTYVRTLCEDMAEALGAAAALRAALLPASHGIRPQTARLRRAGGRNPPKSSFGRFGLRPPFPSQKSQKGAPPTGKGASFLFIRLTATFSGGNTVPTAPPPLPPLR